MRSPRSDTVSWPATLHDGQDNPAVTVEAIREGGRLAVRGGEHVFSIPVRQMRRGARIGSALVLHRVGHKNWQLVLHDIAADAWPHTLPEQGGTMPRARLVLGGIAVVVLGLTASGWFARDTLIAVAAPLLPHKVTEPIGRAYVAEIGPACTAGAGRAALDRLVARLTATTPIAEPLTVTIVDVADINAVALPGGHIAIFRGLLEQAKSPDELAGALAHEIAHVERQHPNQALLREMGPTVLARVLGSDAGRLADLTLLTRGSRAAEAEADGGAIATMHRSRVSPEGVAEFFDRQNAAGSGDGYSSSHPSDASRAARYHAASAGGTEPPMTPSDWQALRAICG